MAVLDVSDEEAIKRQARLAVYNKFPGRYTSCAVEEIMCASFESLNLIKKRRAAQ